MNNKRIAYTAAENKELSASIRKRKVLSSICQKLRRIREHKVNNATSESEAEHWQSLKVNDLLMIFLHNPKSDKEFKTFNQWKNEGKTIIKGSKASIIWGQPIAAKAIKESEETEEDIYKLFPLCYLFSQNQVR